MPIWFELIFLLLITYAIGLAVGWLLWGSGRGDMDEARTDRTGDNA
ncbi:MAG: hypothetical protein WA948_10825 [Pontixanthobacter sp.]